MGRALHDLCQPLTTLQCRLEMAQMQGTAEAYREAVEKGLVECERLTELVKSMRTMLRLATGGGGVEAKEGGREGLEEVSFCGWLREG
jgi:signal transduction histidine kinase